MAVGWYPVRDTVPSRTVYVHLSGLIATRLMSLTELAAARRQKQAGSVGFKVRGSGFGMRRRSLLSFLSWPWLSCSVAGATRCSWISSLSRSSCCPVAGLAISSRPLARTSEGSCALGLSGLPMPMRRYAAARCTRATLPPCLRSDRRCRGPPHLFGCSSLSQAVSLSLTPSGQYSPILLLLLALCLVVDSRQV